MITEDVRGAPERLLHSARLTNTLQAELIISTRSRPRAVARGCNVQNYGHTLSDVTPLSNDIGAEIKDKERKNERITCLYLLRC